MDADVIIVGGAIAGGALANALGSQGVSTLLLEKVTREIHSTRGDNLHPPTLAMLDKWGVLAGLHEDGALPITELAVSAAGRGLVARFPLKAVNDGPDGRTISVPHDRIEAVMYACAARYPSVRIERGTVTGLVQEAGCAVGVRFRPHPARFEGLNERPPQGGALPPARSSRSTKPWSSLNERPPQGGAPEASPEALEGLEGREVVLRARIVVGCDGAASLVRRSVGIKADQEPYDHEQVIIGGEGLTELPAALHWYLDDFGALAVTSRPKGCFRILLGFRLGQRGDLLRQPDPALHDFVVGRFPQLAPLRFGKEDASLYRLSWHVAERFWAPGVALVGDSAHATHPAGATGMSLAVTAAAKLADAIAPLLLDGASDEALDAALEAYDAERRPAAETAVASNHAQAMRIWQSDLHKDPDGYAQAIDPNSGWGAHGAGWGQDPAALRASHA